MSVNFRTHIVDLNGREKRLPKICDVSTSSRWPEPLRRQVELWSLGTFGRNGTIMKKVALTVAVLALGLAACESKTSENVEVVDNNVVVENEVEADVNAADAANSADNALDAAGNAVENAADDAGNAIENAGNAVENAAE